jgi:glycosyltransferase involved in cell wall biosynthesis
MTTRHVLITADPELPVPPRLYGGIERVIDLLIQGLQQRGHRVTLIAHADSTVECERVAYPRVSSRGAFNIALNAWTVRREVRRRRPDVVQSFGRLAYLAPILSSPVPKVMSFQRAITPESIERSRRWAGNTLTLTGCSQRLIEPVAHLAPWRVIYNAVPVDRFAFAPHAGDDAPLMFLGRIEPIKGVHIAIEVARRAHRNLVIAGNIAPEHQAYFDEQVAPQLDGEMIQYIGPIDDAAKSWWLSAAAALLMPVQWEEPFGIVMAEALACGTPVVGLDRGAVPEVVDDGVTGFVCRNADEMVHAVNALPTIDRRECRRAAERRFSAAAMTDAYEALYEQLLSGAYGRHTSGRAVPAARRSAW